MRFLALTLATLFLGSGPQRSEMTVVRVNDHLIAFLGGDATMLQPSANSYAILTTEGVVLYDVPHFPWMAQGVIKAIRQLTQQPIRYVILSHWHWDHVLGSQVIADSFPGAVFLAHRNTKEASDRRNPEQIKGLADARKQIEFLRKTMAAGKSYDGADLTPLVRGKIEQYIANLEPAADEMAATRYISPTETFDDHRVLELGGRRIEIRYFGNANTRGDAVVYLPADRAVLTGDLVVHPIPYSFGAYIPAWIDALDSIRNLRPKTVLPGHGPVMHDLHFVEMLRELFSKTVEQGRALQARGVPDSLWAETADLTAIRARLTRGDPNLTWAFRNYYVEPTFHRLPKVLRNELGDDRAAN